MKTYLVTIYEAAKWYADTYVEANSPEEAEAAVMSAYKDPDLDYFAFNDAGNGFDGVEVEEVEDDEEGIEPEYKVVDGELEPWEPEDDAEVST